MSRADAGRIGGSKAHLSFADKTSIKDTAANEWVQIGKKHGELLNSILQLPTSYLIIYLLTTLTPKQLTKGIEDGGELICNTIKLRIGAANETTV